MRPDSEWDICAYPDECDNLVVLGDPLVRVDEDMCRQGQVSIPARACCIEPRGPCDNPVSRTSW